MKNRVLKQCQKCFCINKEVFRVLKKALKIIILHLKIVGGCYNLWMIK